MSTQSLQELETIIGLRSGSTLEWHINTITQDITVNPNRLYAIRTWLEKQGIPANSIVKSSNVSLARAYVIPNYLTSWRNHVNPRFKILSASTGASAASADMDLLDETDANTEPTNDEPSAEHSEKEPSADKPSTTSAAQHSAPHSAAQNEAWLKALFERIDATVNTLVVDKLNKATLKLDDNAKAQIRALAKQSAQDTIAELAAPRRLEVTDPRSGQTIDLGLQHERFPTLLRAVSARDHRGFRLNVWLTGPTGSGKTSASEATAKALSLPFGSDGSLDADYKVLGFRDANGNIISTQFLAIYEGGGIYVADEIDNWMPSALLSLNAALANGWCSSPRGLIKRHKDACIIACANTWGLGATGDYVGRTRLDAASLDRFQPKIEWPIDEKLERAVAEQQGGTEGLEWHNKVLNARHLAKKQGLKIIISPRATFSGIALLAQGFTPQEVIDMTFASGLSPEQAKAIGATPGAGPTSEAESYGRNNPYYGSKRN